MSVDPKAVQRSVHELMAGLSTGGPRPVPAPSSDLKALVSAAEHVLGVDCVGVLLIDEDDRLCAVAASGPVAAALEESQERTGIGPGVDTVRSEATVAVDDLALDDRYVQLAALVTDRGVRAVVSAPVWVNGTVVGNLNVIRSAPHQWSAVEITAIETYATVVATVLQLSASSVRTARSAGGKSLDA
jgi:GAF domain-containing protein